MSKAWPGACYWNDSMNRISLAALLSCLPLVASGRPYVDRERERIFVRGLYSLQERLDLTHEYLHLAFRAHPSGQDENYVESLARRLLLE